MADKSAQQPARRARKIKQTTLPRFLFGLGIRHVGEATAKELARHFGKLDAIMDATEEQLLEVSDVGPIVAQSIRTFFEQPHNREVVEQLRAGGVTWEEGEPAARRRKPLSGKDLRHHRHAAHPEPRRGQGQGRGGRRQGGRLGQQEDRLRGGRRGGRQQAGQGANAGRAR